MKPKKKLRKQTIVFFCSDVFEKHAAENLAAIFEEAGWSVRFSKSLFRKAHVGIYFGDSHIPSFQHLTVRSINGLDQDHTYPSDASEFFIESNWGKFDLALLPTRRWKQRFEEGIKLLDYTPKYGAVLVGWPKLDSVVRPPNNVRNPKPKVLYAPQMEDGRKQAEVTEACSKLGLELIVKHWESDATRGGAINRQYLDMIDDANAHTKTELGENCTIRPASENITLSLLESDILIADQTSVIYEAAAIGIPTITVRGWKHWCGECPGSGLTQKIAFVAQEGQLRQEISKVLENLQSFREETQRRFESEFVFLHVSSKVIFDEITKKLHDSPKRHMIHTWALRLPSLIVFEIQRALISLFEQLVSTKLATSFLRLLRTNRIKKA